MYNATSNPIVIDTVFYRNIASHQGGGVDNRIGRPVFIRVAFEENQSTLWGGAMISDGPNAYGTPYTFPLLINTTFKKNIAVYGAAVLDTSSSKAVIINALLTENTATAPASGAYHIRIASAPVLINATIANNNGTGIFIDTGGSPLPDAVFVNSIIWGNTAGDILDTNRRGLFFNCMVKDKTDTAINGWRTAAAPTGWTIPGADNENGFTFPFASGGSLEAGLPLKDKGNSTNLYPETETDMLISGTPILDGWSSTSMWSVDIEAGTGTPKTLGTRVAEELVKDIAGNQRIKDSAIDIGAFEQ